MSEEMTAFDRLLAEARAGRLTRRQVMRRGAALGLGGASLATLLAACGGSNSTPVATTAGAATKAATAAGGTSATVAPATVASSLTLASPVASPSASPGTAAAAVDYSKGVKGGTLRVGIVGEPQTLDIHQTTATITFYISFTMFETLFAWDANYQLIPMLAEGLDVSSDGLTNTVHLRKNVPFHDGTEMKAADVVASIKRWGGKSGNGKDLLANTADISTPDDYIVVFKMKKPYGTFAVALCSNSQGCVIMPKSVIDEAGDQPLTKFVGTGPYKFIEHLPDRWIRVGRFDQYANLPGQPNGYGGHKYQFLDEIKFIPVPDEAARVAGLQAGDYDIVDTLSADNYNTLKGSANLVTQVLTGQGWDVFFLNYKSPLTGKPEIRQAFEAALDMAPLMAAGRGQGFYELGPSLMWNKTPWYTDTGKELYNQHDPNKAKQLLQKAGYDGTPLRFITTMQYTYMGNEATVAKQQLEAAGFKVDLQVFDWATVLDRRSKPDQWDAFTTGHGFVPDPTQLTVIGQMGTYPGWWADQDTRALVDQLLAESDFKKRFDIWQQVQGNFWKQVPAVKLGDNSLIVCFTNKLGGWSPQIELGDTFWNYWLKK